MAEMEFDSLFKGDYQEVISPKGENMSYECTKGRDMVFIIPYLKKENKIILRKEWCPPYRFRDQLPVRFVTIVSGGIEENEKPEDAALRELEEETGIKPSEYSFNAVCKFKPYNKGTVDRVFVFIIVIDDHVEVEALGDGTAYEKLSGSFKCGLSEAERIVNEQDADFISQSLFYMFKNKLENGELF